MFFFMPKIFRIQFNVLGTALMHLKGLRDLNALKARTETDEIGMISIILKMV